MLKWIDVQKFDVTNQNRKEKIEQKIKKKRKKQNKRQKKNNNLNEDSDRFKTLGTCENQVYTVHANKKIAKSC